MFNVGGCSYRYDTSTIFPENSLHNSQLVARLPAHPFPYCCSPPKMGELFKLRCNSERIDHKSENSRNNLSLSPDRGTTRPTKNDTLRPPCPALLRARNLVKAGFTRVAQRSTILHIVLTFVIGEGPTILIVCGLVDCRLFLHEKAKELTIYGPYLLGAFPAHRQDIPRAQIRQWPFPIKALPKLVADSSCRRR